MRLAEFRYDRDRKRLAGATKRFAEEEVDLRSVVDCAKEGPDVLIWKSEVCFALAEVRRELQSTLEAPAAAVLKFHRDGARQEARRRFQLMREVDGKVLLTPGTEAEAREMLAQQRFDESLHRALRDAQRRALGLVREKLSPSAADRFEYEYFQAATRPHRQARSRSLVEQAEELLEKGALSTERRESLVKEIAVYRARFVELSRELIAALDSQVAARLGIWDRDSASEETLTKARTSLNEEEWRFAELLK